jgi:hypothetical protein
MKCVEIRAVVSMSNDTDIDVNEFVDAFIEWIEAHGMECGGGFRSIDENGDYIE